MDIFLVRHGEAAAAWGQCGDPGLSELGRQQASAAAQQLLPLVDADTRLVSSPLARAQETAQPLAGALGVAVSIDDAFRELPAPVPLEQRSGWLKTVMQQRWEQQSAELLAWREQAMEHLLGIEGSAVVYTHFMVLNAIVGQLQEQAETVVYLPDNASITRLRRLDTGLELVELGAQLETVIN